MLGQFLANKCPEKQYEKITDDVCFIFTPRTLDFTATFQSVFKKKKNLSVQKICCTTGTERTLVKVLSLSTWGNSYPRTKRELLFIILKIPPFSYALLWFQVVVPSFFGVRLWHAQTLFRAVLLACQSSLVPILLAVLVLISCLVCSFRVLFR